MCKMQSCKTAACSLTNHFILVNMITLQEENLLQESHHRLNCDEHEVSTVAQLRCVLGLGSKLS